MATDSITDKIKQILDGEFDDEGFLESFTVPSDVETCPCCDSPLVGSCEGWEVESKRPTSSDIQVDCSREECYDEYKDSEYWRMPYVYWLPVEETVKRWLYAQYDIAQAALKGE